MYQKARLGLIQQMAVIDSVYEAPRNHEVTIDTSQEHINQSVQKILNFIKDSNASLYRPSVIGPQYSLTLQNCMTALSPYATLS